MGFLTGIGAGLLKGASWLLKNPAILFAAAFSVAFVLVVTSKNAEIATLRGSINDPKTGWVARNAALTKDNQTLRINNATMGQTLVTQSASLDALKNKADAADAKFDLLIAGQTAGNATITKKIATLDKAKPGADKCSSAFDLVRSTVK